MNLRTLGRVGIALVLTTTLTACYVEPADEDVVYQHDELPPGPGLFSGSDGSWTLIGGNNERKRKRF